MLNPRVFLAIRSSVPKVGVAKRRPRKPYTKVSPRHLDRLV